MTAYHSAVRNPGVLFTNLEYEAAKIGTPGGMNFGIGPCLYTLPEGMEEVYGTRDKAADTCGNYMYSEGSICGWVPAFWYMWGTGANGVAIGGISIKNRPTAGHALHRMFWNAGTARPGKFLDKYESSNNGGIASSLLNGLLLSSDATHNPFAALTGAPSNTYGGAIDVAKTRGGNWHACNQFDRAGLAMLAYAHARAATDDTFCAWYDSTGVANFPKGNNNNALGDTNDASILYVTDGFPNAGKTGSANLFNRTTHNGQASGICDLNGNMWEVSLGLTSNGTDYFLLKTSVDIATITSGNTLATDAWGAVGLAAMYDNIGPTYGALWATGANRTVNYGSATQVFSEATSGNAWAAAGAGIPLVGGIGGTNAFGNDILYDYKPNEMCPISGGSWAAGSLAGIWALNLSGTRSSSNTDIGCRSACFLEP